MFACYGSHLHGDELGSLGRKPVPASLLIAADTKRVLSERQWMDQPAYSMSGRQREAVLSALVERCSDRGWNLRAAHVRSHHLHLIVDGDAQPGRILNDLKSSASRCLNRLGLDGDVRRHWARHGSTRRLFDQQNVSDAIRYVVDQQGAPMSVFEAVEK